MGKAEAIRMRAGRSGMPADGPAPAERRDSPLPMDAPGKVSRTTDGLWEQGKNGAKS